MAESYYNSSLTAEQIEATLLGSVRGDATQNKTAEWKTKARQNIGAAGADDVVAIAKGGTGGTTAAAARTNLGLGTAACADVDATLTKEKAVADAIAVGESVFVDANTESRWVLGAISSSGGANSTSTTRLRTVTYIPTEVKTITAKDGYKYMLFAYDSSETYIGVWNGVSFTKSANWLTDAVSLITLPNYQYRIVFAFVADGEITTSEYENISLFSSVTDAVNRMKAAAFVANLDTTMVTRLGTNEQADFNDVLLPGTYSVVNTAAVPNVLNMPESTPGKLFVTSVTSSARIYQIYLTFTGNAYIRSNYSTWSGWKMIGDTLTPPIDGTDASGYIRYYANRKKTIRLGAGTFIVHSITVPEDVCIEGAGTATVLQLNPDYPNAPVLIMSKGSRVRNLKIVGAGGEDYDASEGSTVGSSHGISVDSISGTDLTNRLRIVIRGVEIAGFTGAGIYLNNTGTNIGDSCSISDCYVHNCHAGIYTKKSEYHRISNSAFNGCYYGAYNNGGNNVFSNCGLNGCVIGCYIENLDGSSTNNTHGTFSSCTFNHEHDISVKIEGVSGNTIASGEVFVGCQFAYGGIEIDYGTGIHFADCNFLSSTPITVGGSGFSLFSQCVFINETQTPVTKTGSGVLRFDGCYLRNGSAYNPV